MKAVYLTALREMEVRQAPDPKLSGPHDVLLRVDTLGVCGSDIHYYARRSIGPQFAPFPFVLGHELAGTVMETGSQVTALKSGQRVSVDPLIPCGHCDQCLSGRRHTCREQKFLGSSGQAGGLSEYLVMPDVCCYPVPDTLSDDEAAMVEPLSIGVYAVQMALRNGLESGAKVGIVGSGPIGLCALLAVRAEAQVTTYVTDPVEYRLEAARAAGATWAGNPDREDVEAVIQSLEPLGLDVVFECAGEQAAIDQAVDLLKPGGALFIIGIPEVDRISFNISLIRRKELRIFNVRRQNECVERAIELIATKKVNVAPLVTHHFPLEQTPPAFEMVSARRDGVLKAIIRVS
jgi:L-iditol 2-dehydrogenase